MTNVAVEERESSETPAKLPKRRRRVIVDADEGKETPLTIARAAERAAAEREHVIDEVVGRAAKGKPES